MPHYEEADYTSHSFEKVPAGGSFSTPYTKSTYYQRYSLRIAEIMPLRRSAPAFHQGLVYDWGNLRRTFEATLGWDKPQPTLTVGKLKALHYLATAQEGPDADIARLKFEDWSCAKEAYKTELIFFERGSQTASTTRQHR